MNTKKTHISIITLGCSKNTVDSEKLAGMLNENGLSTGFEYVEGKSTDVIINTCGFILDAKEESIDYIFDYLALKKEKKITSLLVIGCLSKRYRNELKTELPEVDAFFGTNEERDILAYYNLYPSDISKPKRLLSTPAHYAFLKISEGCNRNCAFCAIPAIRGKHISFSEESILAEARFLIEKGVKEIILIAQDITYYGMDTYGKRSLADLVDKIAGLEGLKWLRLHYAYPASFPLELLDVMADHENICNYLDIPVQHISDPVLKAMKRGHDAKTTIKLLKTIREKLPDAAIRSTLITGFPGESEDDFRLLYDFVEETRFDRLGVFTYSHEEGTPAFSLNDDVPDQIKIDRMEKIMSLQQSISEQLNKNKIGKILQVIIDQEDDKYYYARTPYDSPEIDNEVLIQKVNSYHCLPGDIINVTITGSSEFDLFGEINY